MFNEILEKLHSGLSIDVKYRIISLQSKKIGFIFLDFLTSSTLVNDIIFSIVSYPVTVVNANNLLTHLMINTVTKSRDINQVMEAILKGEMGIFIEDDDEVIIVDTKKYPGRAIGEPDSEKVVRGSRDGFTETLSTNIGLVRRRIASEDLIVEGYEIGKSSKTKVALIYLKNRIHDLDLKDIRKRLETVDTLELTMSDKALEEHITGNPYSPYPLVKYTERPDTFSSHLYQGMFGILVDTSPSALLGPVSIFDHLQHAEEFRQTIIAGSYLRFIRFFGIIIGFLSLPVWFLLLAMGKVSIDMSFNKAFLQLILIELTIEVLRMASIHTPSALSTSMGLIAGLVVGNMAVEIGIVNQKIVFLGCISALSSYITPSYELSIANKMANIVLLALIYFFKLPGFIIGMLSLIVYLATLKSFRRHYLYPLLPFNLKAFFKQIFRKPYIKNEKS